MTDPVNPTDHEAANVDARHVDAQRVDAQHVDPPLAGHADLAPRRPGWGFMARHPAHWIALGFGSGLAPRAPGTVGTLWGWASFLVLSHWLTPWHWGWVIAVSLPLGWWAATVTARHLRTCDPGAIVWDEIVSIWIILWLLMPANVWWQLAAFGVFRYFDAAKPGPVRWADGLFKTPPGHAVGPWQGLGIYIDDLVAAGCTLLVLAAARLALG